ncbi:cold shock domain-containing protein [Acinetobacter junii]|uniref:cold shock domain-containing protein n=1 Tax=Acinetobacter junii TaxID=40215 RepID=UPI003A8408D5
MFVEGKIKKYDTERGFGFIKVDGHQTDVFFHIKDFPKASVEPKIGENLRFLIVEDNNGKFKAANIVRLDQKQAHIDYPNYANNSSTQDKSVSQQKHANHKGMTFMIISLIVIAILGALVFKKYQSYAESKELKTAQLIAEQKKIVQQQRDALGELPEIKLSQKTENALQASTTVPVMNNQSQQSTANQTQFKCDGRQHCSQMKSYDEALWFIRNCSGTQMDGDNDGEPCERQFDR